MTEMNARTCVICDHPERDAIEAHRNAGAPYSMIARALKKIGAFDDGMSARSAARRVAIHFQEHEPDPGWG